MLKRVPKLPKNSYKLPLKVFLKLIKKYPKEVRVKLLNRYNAISSAIKMQEIEKNNRVNKTGFGKLTDYQRMYIIEMASRFFSPSQILKMIREEWGIKYSNVALNGLLKRHALEIEHKRNRYVSNLDSLRLVHERPRIEELTNLYEDAKDEGDKKLAVNILSEIRQEVKGNRLTIDATLDARVNVDVKTHLMENVDLELFGKIALIKILERHKIDFNRFAHRLGKTVIEKDDQGNVINKTIPVKVEGISLNKKTNIEEVDYKEIENKKNSNVDDLDVEKVKKLLEKKIKAKKLQAEKVEVEVKNLENPKKKKNDLKRNKRKKNGKNEKDA